MVVELWRIKLIFQKRMSAYYIQSVEIAVQCAEYCLWILIIQLQPVLGRMHISMERNQKRLDMILIKMRSL